MPFFFHPDIKDIHIRVSYLSKGVINIYDFLKQDPNAKINTPDFVYPPLTYFTLGGYQILVKPLLGNDFNNWLFNFSGTSAKNPYIFRYLFLLKLPYLLFDFLIGYILYRLFSGEAQQKRVLLFWFFNPLNLYGIYILGQFDIIPTCLTFLAWYTWTKNKFKSAGILLGLGIAFKSFPLVLIPFFLTSKVNIRNKFKFLTRVIAVYIVTTFPFILSPGFQKDVLFSDLGERIFTLQIHFGSVNISIFTILYLTLIGYSLFKKTQPLWVFILSVLLLVLSVSHFHPQWIVWITPFLVLTLVNRWALLIFIVLILISYPLHILQFDDRFLNFGILSPIFPNIYHLDPLHELLFSMIDKSSVNFVDNIIFYAISILLLCLVYKNNISKKLHKNLAKINKSFEKGEFFYLNFINLVLLCSLLVVAIVYSSKQFLGTTQTDTIKQIPIYKDHPFIQKITGDNDLLDLIYIRLNNNDLKNSDNFTFKLYSSDTIILREIKLSGQNIGFNDMVKLTFDPLPKSSNKLFYIMLESETTDPVQAIKVDQNKNGDSIYELYYKGSVQKFLVNSFEYLKSKIAVDTTFYLFYLFIISINIATLIFYTFAKMNDNNRIKNAITNP